MTELEGGTSIASGPNLTEFDAPLLFSTERADRIDDCGGSEDKRAIEAMKSASNVHVAAKQRLAVSGHNVDESSTSFSALDRYCPPSQTQQTPRCDRTICCGKARPLKRKLCLIVEATALNAKVCRERDDVRIVNNYSPM